jgi:cell division protein FtsQ
VDQEDILNILYSQGIRLHGTHVSELNRNQLRQAILAFPGVFDAKVYNTPDGTLNIDVLQRKPVIRLINPGESWFVDRTGIRIPASGRYSPRVLLVSGIADEGFLRDSIGPLAGFISGDPVLDTLVQGLMIQPDRTIEIVTSNTSSRFFMGDASGFEWKLEKLKIFYDKCIPLFGWDDYSKIDLRYENQIVAKKWSESELDYRDSIRMARDTAGTDSIDRKRGHPEKINRQERPAKSVKR